jgi:hypothetical protein
MPYDAPTLALAAALHAVRPDSGYFTLSPPGTITVLDDGGTRFLPTPGGNHRYLILDPGRKDDILRTYAQLVSAKPFPVEPPEFIRQLEQEQQKKKEPPK